MENSDGDFNAFTSASISAEPERPSLECFPVEILLSVTSLLEPADLFRSRYVSRQWHRIFTSPVVLRDMVVREYPRAREVQRLLAAGAPVQTKAWKEVFDKVFARYCALTSGYFYSEKQIKLHGSAQPSRSPNLPSGQYTVSQWRRDVSLHAPPAYDRISSAPCEPFWTCDDGLLVYLDGQRDTYAVLDLQSNKSSTICFDITGRIVRRLRFRAGVLIFEWCQKRPYHQLNPTEEVHRHFVTAFDIVPVICDASQQTFKITLRSEWKLHFLGFPLNSRDLWISAHNQDHYAVYIWQRNRSAWGEDEPLESLFVWDISQPSTYRPSEDPSGTKRPCSGPFITQSMTYKDLDFLGIRQRDTPHMRGLGIDGSMLKVIEARYFGEGGDHAGPHVLDKDFGWNWIRTTSMPIQGIGPCHVKISTKPWLSLTYEPGDLESRRAQLSKLDKFTFDSAYLGQTWTDEVASIRFAVSVSRNGGAVCLIADGWSSVIQLAEFNTRSDYVNIYGDEKRLIMEIGGNIWIRYFDCHSRGEGVRSTKQNLIPSVVKLGHWRSGPRSASSGDGR